MGVSKVVIINNRIGIKVIERKVFYNWFDDITLQVYIYIHVT
jgi:hypothetical protein